jgi:hypothetical protein
MNKNTIGFLALATVLAGCSESTAQPQARCELMTAQICSRAADAQLHSGALTVSYTFQPEDPRVVLLVVPVFRQDGVLAVEVDCYANTDSHSYSIIRSGLAIPPESLESVAFLRDRHLCAENGSYAEEKRLGVETASAVPAVSR